MCLAATSEVWVEQLLPGVAQQGVGEHQVQGAQQQVVGVDQVVADHREVPCGSRAEAARGGVRHFLLFLCALRLSESKEKKNGMNVKRSRRVWTRQRLP